MTIWTSKVIAAGGLALALAACDPAMMGGTPITQTQFAGGAVTLATPPGYCIDPRRTRSGADQSMAIIARCDRLGQNGGRPRPEALAVMVATAIPLPDGTGPMTTRDLAGLINDGTVDQRQDRPDIAMIRVRSDSVPDRFGPYYWRGAFRVNGQLMGVTLYAPDGSGAAGRDGADLLENLARRTRRASDA